MKKLMLTAICGCLILMTFGQRVDIDNKRMSVEFAKCPTHYVPEDQRTFVVELVGSSGIDPEFFYDQIFINGWEQVDEDANAKIKVSAGSVGLTDPQEVKRVDEKKDKEGNVTSRTNYYKWTQGGVGKAAGYVYGPENKMAISKWEKKQAAKAAEEAAEKKEEVNSNPFLSGTSAGEELEDAAEGSDRIAFGDLTRTYSYETSEYTSSTKARTALLNLTNSKLSAFRADYPNDLVNSTNNFINGVYGFSKGSDYVKFKVLDSKKHPENEMYNQATDAMFKILETKKWNEPMESLVSDLAPIIEYFEGVKGKYSSDDKQDVKLKSATMWNLATLYYYLDMPDKTTAIGQEFVRWGEDEKDGEEFIEMGDSLTELLSFHNITQRCYVR